MIYLRKFNESKENKESIESICKKYGITNYTINDDGSIDVDGSVSLKDKGLTKLPLKFRNVTEHFYCSNNQLTTLEGAPQSVGGDFYCTHNELTTLEGAPQSVVGSFYCLYNNLTTLESAPQSVGGDFSCSYNQLTTLEGAPQSVGGDFFCNNNQLTTLEGAPQSVDGDFFCTYNQLVNLEFSPSCHILYCINNPIHKWWSKVGDVTKLDSFIDLGIDSRDPDFMNQEKIDLLLEQ